MSEMTTEEKAKKYDQIAGFLWDSALYGNLMQSTMAANYIRALEIPSPKGDDPESA